MPPPSLTSARKHYGLSALIAARAAAEAVKVRPRGVAAVATVVATHQAAQAVASQMAVAEMLAEQEVTAAADAMLNSLAFTTSTQTLTDMLSSTVDQDFARLVESLVQDAGRAAESVATAVRADIWHVRYLSPPSCSRCAVLAGRVYRYSEGFLRHPNCDCVMVPTTVAKANAQDPVAMLEAGQVTGLSKADARAIADGADFARVVNVRLRKAGLGEPGRVLYRRGKLTPEAIYRTASTREQAVELLHANGYTL